VDVRAAQQLSVLASVPPLAIDLLAWRLVAAMFDCERLVTGRHG